jgi:hypothetical protein
MALAGCHFISAVILDLQPSALSTIIDSVERAFLSSMSFLFFGLPVDGTDLQHVTQQKDC